MGKAIQRYIEAGHPDGSAEHFDIHDAAVVPDAECGSGEAKF